MRSAFDRVRLYWPLTKPLQTGLLLATGLAGYMSARCPVTHPITILGLAGSLFLAIAGSTMLNMWWDRDIDARMGRTSMRATPAGLVSGEQALRFGLLLSTLGVAWAALMGPLYCLAVFAGMFFDVVIYSMWLKRRTAWSIVWGGIAGAMPILAGRALGTGHIDWIGVTLGLGILLWIPTHTLTFSLKYAGDYARAGIPTFPSTYGARFTRTVISLSSILAAAAMASAGIGIGMAWGFLRLLSVLSAGLLLLAAATLFLPSERINSAVFKYASIYMLASMLMLSLI